MDKEILNSELKFLVQLREIALQALIDSKFQGNKLTEGFDIAKGIQVIERVMDAEIEYLFENPEDYYEIYN